MAHVKATISTTIGKMATIIVAVVCSGVLCCMLGGCASTGGQAADQAGGITVSGSSETKVVPDKARIGVSVVTEAKTPEACQKENAESANAVIAALKELGVADESVQTNYANLSPRYGSRSSSQSNSSEGDASYDEWVITGYEMTTSFSVSDLEIDNVGAVIQACVEAGASQTSGIEYYASNYDQAYNEALAKALEMAKAKADGIAAATGAHLGKVTSVTEGYQDTSARYVANAKEMYAMGEESADVDSVAQTMPGQLDIRAEVTVTYAIS